MLSLKLNLEFIYISLARLALGEVAEHHHPDTMDLVEVTGHHHPISEDSGEVSLTSSPNL